MAEKLEVYEDKKEERLQRFLDKIPQFQNEKERHYLFASYDHHEEEEHMYEFWRDTVHSLIGKVFKRTYASVNDIQKCFAIHNGQKPSGLHNIMIEMKMREEFIPLNEILDESHYEEAGWITRNLGKLTSWLSTPAKEQLDKNTMFVSKVWLENVCNSIIDWAQRQEQQVFTQQQVESLILETGRDKLDSRAVMIHLRRTDRMKTDHGLCKFGHKGEVSDITQTELTLSKLTRAAEELDKRIEMTDEKIKQLRHMAKEALREKDKAKATKYLQEMKNYQKAETVLNGQKLKIDQQIMEVTMMLSTKDTLEVLKHSSGQQKMIDEDIEDAEEIITAISDQNYNLNKINEMFTVEEDEVEDEELLKELEEETTDAEEVDQYQEKSHHHTEKVVRPALEVDEDEYGGEVYEEQKQVYA